jgi:hypothetical protein
MTTVQLPDPTVIATYPALFHAVETPDAINVYSSPLVDQDDEMWQAVRARLNGRPFVEIPAETRADASMMFGQATTYLYVFQQ